MPKQKKNSQEEELYFDIISPSPIIEEEVSSKNKVYQIPIKKEKFSCMPRNKKEPELAEDEEYVEVIEEVEEEEEPEIKKKSRVKKPRKPFFLFKKRAAKAEKTITKIENKRL